MSKKYKDKIPAAVRNSVWNTYIGTENSIGKCLCCSLETISRGNYHCGHVISEKNHGKVTIQNLRPICLTCNTSMGTQNMISFIKKHGLSKHKNWHGIEPLNNNKFNDNSDDSINDNSDDSINENSDDDFIYENSDDDFINENSDDGKFMCNKCNTSFRGSYDLSRHQNRLTDCVTGSKTSKKIIFYACDGCKQKYPRKDSLDRHAKTCTVKINKNKRNKISNNKTNIDINSFNSINLFVFGEDGYDNLLANEITKILYCDGDLLTCLVEIVNCNPNKPNHHNIYYNDIKSAYGEIFEKNKKWNKKKIDDILEILIDAKIKDLNDLLNNFNHFNKKSRNKIKETITHFDASHTNARKNLKSYLKLLLYNNKDMIKITRKMTRDLKSDNPPSQEESSGESSEEIPARIYKSPKIKSHKIKSSRNDSSSEQISIREESPEEIPVHKYKSSKKSSLNKKSLNKKSSKKFFDSDSDSQ